MNHISFFIKTYTFLFLLYSGTSFAFNNCNPFQYEKAAFFNDFLYTATVNANTSLNVRNTPNLKGKKVGNLKTGQQVKVLKHTNSYFSLELKNRTAYGQWVYISYLDTYKRIKKGYVYDYFLDMSVSMKKLGYTIPEAINKFKKNKDCIIENVSDEFLFSIEELSYDKENYNRIERVRIEIQGITDNNTTFQRIDYNSSNWLSYNKIPCKATNYFEIKQSNISLEIQTLGHLIIWDYNIDGLVDIAIMEDLGGNGGSWYTFYMQQKDGSFKTEEYPFSLFPTDIDYEKKTITQIHPFGCCKVSGSVYKKEKEKWLLIKSIHEDM